MPASSPSPPSSASAVAGVVDGRSAAAAVVVFVALEQRIALELRLDEGVELEVGQLQQPNRLLQLRRHHQLLALPQLELAESAILN